MHRQNGGRPEIPLAELTLNLFMNSLVFFLLVLSGKHSVAQTTGILDALRAVRLHVLFERNPLGVFFAAVLAHEMLVVFAGELMDHHVGVQLFLTLEQFSASLAAVIFADFVTRHVVPKSLARVKLAPTELMNI